MGGVVEHHAGRTIGGVPRQDGLDNNVQRRRVERLQHGLGRLFAVGFGVEQDRL